MGEMAWGLPYVRIFSNDNTANEMNHSIEMEVYGKTT